MDLQKLVRIMGPMPGMYGKVMAQTGVLTAREVKGLEKVITRYGRMFPQSRLSVVMRSFPQEVELGVILFWVFNNAGLSDAGKRLGANHDLLILIDPTRREAGVMVGYGLEPLLAKEEMEGAMKEGVPFLERGEFAEAVEVMVEALTESLKKISESWREIFGLEREEIMNDEL